MSRTQLSDNLEEDRTTDPTSLQDLIQGSLLDNLGSGYIDQDAIG
jgi:hypothetical protein